MAKRTSDQNRFFHGIVVPLFAEHFRMTPQEAKINLALECQPQMIRRFNGDIVTVPGSTSEMTEGEFEQFLDSIRRLGERHGLTVPPQIDLESWREMDTPGR